MNLFIVNINPEIIIANYNNEKFKEILNEQKYQIPDGTGVVWASKKNNGGAGALTPTPADHKNK